ncbi:MAG: hypothetical protein R2882_05020 [Gemmatimonadales bacterium]
MKFSVVVGLVASLGPFAVPAVSQVPVSDLQYQVTFNRATAAVRSFDVSVSFAVSRSGPVELSLPAWTPGAYEISNFARHLSAFAASQGGQALDWDKVDFDTWRVVPAGSGRVTVSYRFEADSLDNAMAWARPDFAFANGTNLFLYPEGADLATLPAAVTVTTEPDWTVATAMTVTGPGHYRAGNYHDLVDMPFFIGRIDVDSARIDGAWHRVASYPAGVFGGDDRRLFWDQLGRTVPAMARVFGETPWPDYTTLIVFDSAYGGGSALEHQNSHLGIYNPGFIGTPILASITAHEIFHAWNVKRLRPAEMVPYRYDRPQPTTLLWVSEGITDYYSDLALVRGGVIDSTVFLGVTAGKIGEVADAVPVALEDASLSTWIQPTDGTATLYYPKGSLAGLLIDILIRDATGNKASLDNVMRNLYGSVYRAGKGFTDADWWNEVARVAGRDLRAELWARYVDGRDPFPWPAVAPLAGLRFSVDSIAEPRMGLGSAEVGGKQVVTVVAPGSAAAAAGILPGDALIRIGDIDVDASFGTAYRFRYRRRVGERIPVIVSRDGLERTLQLEVRTELRVEQRLDFDRRASLKAARIRHGILTGTTDPS